MTCTKCNSDNLFVEMITTSDGVLLSEIEAYGSAKKAIQDMHDNPCDSVMYLYCDNCGLDVTISKEDKDKLKAYGLSLENV